MEGFVTPKGDMAPWASRILQEALQFRGQCNWSFISRKPGASNAKKHPSMVLVVVY